MFLTGGGLLQGVIDDVGQIVFLGILQRISIAVRLMLSAAVMLLRKKVDFSYIL